MSEKTAREKWTLKQMPECDGCDAAKAIAALLRECEELRGRVKHNDGPLAVQLRQLAEKHARACAERSRLAAENERLTNGVELYRMRLEEMHAERDRLRGAASLSEEIEVAARDMPDGLLIVIGVERGAAWVDFVDEDGECAGIDLDGSLAESVKAAVSMAAAREGSDDA